MADNLATVTRVQGDLLSSRESDEAAIIVSKIDDMREKCLPSRFLER